MAGRVRPEGEKRRNLNGPRKTLKFLLDGHFQWTAFNTESFKFFGSGGGTYTAKDGSKYIGKFVDGKILKGTAIYPGGAKYIGEFKDYFPHGYGTFVWANGEKYYGQWQNGLSLIHI